MSNKMQWINALSTNPSLEKAVEEVADKINSQLTDTPDFGIVFISSAFASDYPRLMPILLDKLPLPCAVGCGGGGIVGVVGGHVVVLTSCCGVLWHRPVATSNFVFVLSVLSVYTTNRYFSKLVVIVPGRLAHGFWGCSPLFCCVGCRKRLPFGNYGRTLPPAVKRTSRLHMHNLINIASS